MRLHVHLDPVVLNPGSGDPAKLIERAVLRMQERARQHGAYVARAVLLDSDTRGRAPDREERAFAMARKAGLILIWQEPCHEALLQRHLPGCEQLHPATAVQAQQDLKRRWPDYEKGAPAAFLAKHIGDDELLRALAVEAELRAFLLAIGHGRQ